MKLFLLGWVLVSSLSAFADLPLSNVEEKAAIKQINRYTRLLNNGTISADYYIQLVKSVKNRPSADAIRDQREERLKLWLELFSEGEIGEMEYFNFVNTQVMLEGLRRDMLSSN